MAGASLRSGANVTFRCADHVVRCPKYRRKVLTGDIERRLKGLIREVIEKKRARLIEMETMPDHVRLLVEVDPRFGIHRLVRAVKGHTSRLLRQEFPSLRSRLPALWTNSYFVATVGGATLEGVRQYIAEQKNR